MWSAEVPILFPQGPTALERLTADLQGHSLAGPITGQVQIQAHVRLPRLPHHYLPTGAVRADAPQWAPIPRRFIEASIGAMTNVGVLAKDCRISSLRVEAGWANLWDLPGPGYSLDVTPDGEDGAADRRASEYARRILAAELWGQPDFRPPTEVRPGPARQWDMPPRDNRWLSRLLRAIWPHRTERWEYGPVALQIQVTRAPRSRHPDIVRLIEAVMWAMDWCRIIIADLTEIAQIAVQVEPGREPRTVIELSVLPEFWRRRVWETEES